MGEQNKTAEKWVMVPVEPTPAMLHAMWQDREAFRGQSENKTARHHYALMLAAAPKAEPAREQAAHISCKNNHLSAPLPAEQAALAAQQAPPQPAGAMEAWVKLSTLEQHRLLSQGHPHPLATQPAAPAQPPAKVEREGLTEAEITAAMDAKGIGHQRGENIARRRWWFTMGSVPVVAFSRAIEAAVYKKLGIAPSLGERKDEDQ